MTPQTNREPWWMEGFEKKFELYQDKSPTRLTTPSWVEWKQIMDFISHVEEETKRRAAYTERMRAFELLHNRVIKSKDIKVIDALERAQREILDDKDIAEAILEKK